MIIDKNYEATFTGTFDLDLDLFAQICGLDDNSPKGFELYTTKKVQNRKHRKRRINKKWAKRYGFRDVMDQRLDCDITYAENVDGVFTFNAIKRGEKNDKS